MSKISTMTPSGTLNGTEIFPLVKGGSNVSGTLEGVKNYIKSGTLDYLDTSLVLTDITPVATGLSLSLLAGSFYTLDSVLLLDGDTDGIRLTFEYSGILNTSRLQYHTGAFLEDISIAIPLTLSDITSLPIIKFSGLIYTDTAGTLTITARKNTDVGADSTVEASSYLAVRQH